MTIGGALRLAQCRAGAMVLTSAVSVTLGAFESKPEALAGARQTYLGAQGIRTLMTLLNDRATASAEST